MSIRLNVIDRKGKKTAIEVEEGTSIKDAIEEKMSPDNFGNCGGICSHFTYRWYYWQPFAPVLFNGGYQYFAQFIGSLYHDPAPGFPLLQALSTEEQRPDREFYHSL